MSSEARPLIAVQCWIYSRLLGVYPRRFRDQFAPWMAQLFRDQLVARRPGFISLMSFWSRALWDLSVNAVREHFSPTQSSIVPQHRSAGGPGMLEVFFLDLKYAARYLRNNPSFTLLAIVTLGLGIGANSAIFSVVNGVLLRPLPYQDADQIHVIFQHDRLRGTQSEGFSGPDYRDLVEQQSSFSMLAAYRTVTLNFSGADAEPERLRSAAVTPDFFKIYSLEPQLGRSFTEEECVPGGPAVVVLNHSFWTRRFGARADVLGETVTLEGQDYEVIGVMPPQALSFGERDLWLPLQPTRRDGIRGVHSFIVLGRLSLSATLETANRELAAIAGRLEEEYPDDNQGRGMHAVPLQEQITGQVRPALIALLVAVGVVLLIACVNVANLLLARGMSRGREVAVRSALGASQSRMLRQFAAESVLFGGSAGMLALAIAYGGVRLLNRLSPANLPRQSEIGVDATVLWFTLALAVATACLFGILPVLQSARTNLVDSLRDGGQSSRGGGSHRMRSILVVAEVALTVVLVVGAGLLLRSFWELLRVDPGFRPEGVLTLSVQLPASRYPQQFPNFPNWPEVQQFQRELEERVQALPDVRAASLAVNHPLNPGFTTRFQISGHAPITAGEQPEATVRPISPTYFDTVGLEMAAGRRFSAVDRADSQAVMIVNEAMVRQHFKEDDDPIGMTVSFFNRPYEVVGIARDVHFSGIAVSAPPAMYTPLEQVPFGGFSILVRSTADTAPLVSQIQREIWRMDPSLAIYGIRELTDMLDVSVGQPRFNAMLVGLFAVVALLLSTIGVYGVMNYLVSQRTQEIGLRMALGADRRTVLSMIVGRGVVLTVIGVVLGLAGSFGLSRAMSNLLFGVTAVDPLTYLFVAALLVAVAALASYVPARRAATVDPLSALRCE